MKKEPYLDLGLEWKNWNFTNNDIFAILDDRKYRIRSSGTIKYGNIKIHLIKKKKRFSRIERQRIIYWDMK